MQLLTDCYRYRLQPIFKSFNLTDTDTDVYIWITCRYQFCQKYRPSDTDNWSIAKCNFQKNSLVLIKYLKYTWLEHRQTLKSWLWKRHKLHDWLCESTAPSFVFNLTTIGAFFALLTLRSYFCGWGQVQKLFWDLPKYTINFGFGCTAPFFCF